MAEKITQELEHATQIVLVHLLRIILSQISLTIDAHYVIMWSIIVESYKDVRKQK